MVEAGEEWVRSLGFSVFRVRHLANLGGMGVPGAKLQIALAEMKHLSKVQAQLEGGLRSLGYSLVEIDPAGYP